MSLDSFSPLNFVLSLSGLHLLPNNLWIKIFNWTCLLLTVIASLCWLIESRDDLFNTTRQGVSALIWSTEIVNKFFFIFVIMKNRKYLNSIVKRILPLLSKKDKRCLWKLSLSGCTCSILLTIHVFVGYLVLYFLQKHTEENSTLFETIHQIFIEKDCFSVCGRFVYCFYIRLISLREKQFLQKIEKESKSLTPGNVSNQLRKLLAFKKFVQDRFSILPVFWFSKELLFCLESVLTHQQSWSKQNPTLFWSMNVMPSLYSLLAHIFLVCYVDHCKQDVDAQIDRLTHLLASQDYDKWHTIMNELDRAKGFNFTASNLFDINKRTGLSFISSLITLTVLFEQLLSKLPVE